MEAYAIGTLGYNTAVKIIHAFETGRTTGGYDIVTVIPGDTGGLSYSWFQLSDSSNNLDLAIKKYIALGGKYAQEFKPYLNLLAKNQGAGSVKLKELLRTAGSDPAMHLACDSIFMENFGAKAVQFANTNLGLQTSLGFAIVLDSFVHSGRVRSDIRAMFKELPPSKGGVEEIWLRAYVNARLKWLLSRKAPIPNTRYRMDTFTLLLNTKNFNLILPFDAIIGRSKLKIT